MWERVADEMNKAKEKNNSCENDGQQLDSKGIRDPTIKLSEVDKDWQTSYIDIELMFPFIPLPAINNTISWRKKTMVTEYAAKFR